MNKEPSHAELKALWDVCVKFIEEQRIWCIETIYQSDRVIENATEFIEDVCNVVGCYLPEDEE
jgi:hypothetical protein